MSNIIAFPRRKYRGRGIVHVLPAKGGGKFEVSHESASGDSWGGFDVFDTVREALGAAHVAAQEKYGDCEVSLSPEARAAMRRRPGGEF